MPDMIFVSGPVFALLAAVLFGISPVLIKVFGGTMPPVLMAGILYLGSGIGLLALRAARREAIVSPLKSLPKPQKAQLALAVLSGGVLAPICLTYGIFYSSAFQVSALLNLETVASTLIAWLVFHEHVGRRVWLGKAAIVFGAVLIGAQGKSGMGFSLSGFWIIGACTFWGIDNNLTRNIEDIPPSLLAGIKGWAAGLFNIALALLLKQTSNDLPAITVAFAVGFVSYGLSLVFFVYALRKIGTSRTATYFATAPFVGMLASIAFLAERPPFMHWIAGLFMLIGVCVLYRETHEHEHTHEEMTHRHMHVHDEHHQHEHDGTEGPEPHDHVHHHSRLTHSHPHSPDIHHRHDHK